VTKIQLQDYKTIAIYADIKGYSMVVVGADLENPVNLYLLHEHSSSKFSPEQLKGDLLSLQRIYQSNKVLVNIESICELIGNYPEVKSVDVVSQSLKLMGLIEDKHIKLGEYADIFQQELDRFDPGNISHRLNALFLGLTNDFKIRASFQGIVINSNLEFTQVKRLFQEDNNSSYSEDEEEEILKSSYRGTTSPDQDFLQGYRHRNGYS
jgi:hypothetical protein